MTQSNKLIPLTQAKYSSREDEHSKRAKPPQPKIFKTLISHNQINLGENEFDPQGIQFLPYNQIRRRFCVY